VEAGPVADSRTIRVVEVDCGPGAPGVGAQSSSSDSGASTLGKAATAHDTATSATGDEHMPGTLGNPCSPTPTSRNIERAGERSEDAEARTLSQGANEAKGASSDAFLSHLSGFSQGFISFC